jgi:hypothetical protein
LRLGALVGAVALGEEVLLQVFVLVAVVAAAGHIRNVFLKPLIWQAQKL